MPRKILKRLLEELNGWFKQKTQTNQQELGGQPQSTEPGNINEDVLGLIRNLSEMVQRITRAGFRSVIIIDALNKVDDTGKTAKVIYIFIKKKNVCAVSHSRNTETTNTDDMVICKHEKYLNSYRFSTT